MSYTGYTLCPGCGEAVFMNIKNVADHFVQKHHLEESAHVLSINMFTNVNAYQEACVILKELDRNKLVIDSLKKERRTLLQKLSKKEEIIRDLTSSIKNFETLSNDAAVEMQKFEADKIIESEILKKENKELKVHNKSLSSRCENSTEDVFQDFEAKHIIRVAENCELKDCIDIQQEHLRYMLSFMNSMKLKIIHDRNAFKIQLKKLSDDLTKVKSESNQKFSERFVERESCNKQLKSKQRTIIVLQNRIKKMKASHQEIRKRILLRCKTDKLSLRRSFKVKKLELIKKIKNLEIEHSVKLKEKNDALATLMLEREKVEAKLSFKENEILSITSKFKESEQVVAVLKSKLMNRSIFVQKYLDDMDEMKQMIGSAVLFSLDFDCNNNVVNVLQSCERELGKMFRSVSLNLVRETNNSVEESSLFGNYQELKTPICGGGLSF